MLPSLASPLICQIAPRVDCNCPSQTLYGHLTRPPASKAGLTCGTLLIVACGLRELHESHFGGIFLCVVDELAVIPVACWNVPALDGDGA